ncbi:MAG: endoglucanase [Desulfobacterales bacterium]|nr:endoglucanase [Desulfobacterales bacterium]
MINILLNTILFSIMLLFNSIPCSAKDSGLPFLWGVAIDGYPITASNLKSIENEIKISPQIVVFFLQWPSAASNDIVFPETTLDVIWQNGAIPCMTWEPMYYEKNEEKIISYQRIIKGEYDPYIEAFAKKTASFEKTFIIRFAHEMNIERYHWGTDKKGYGPDSPKLYKHLFKYVVSKFKEAGGKKVLWAFCPNAESVPNTSYDKSASWNQVINYYPGDEYVDILGIDGYNWGTTQTLEKNGWKSDWKSFKDIFSPTYHVLKSIAPSKPIFIFETASANQGGDKSVWVKEAFKTAEQWGIQGLIWFHVNKEIDWRFNSKDLMEKK